MRAPWPDILRRQMLAKKWVRTAVPLSGMDNRALGGRLSAILGWKAESLGSGSSACAWD